MSASPWRCTQELKAALDEAIASLARRPDISALLLERLLAAVVVQPAAGAGQAGVPRYDITYQLNEIEVRRGPCAHTPLCLSRALGQRVLP